MYGKRLIDRFLIARLMVRREVKSNLTTFSAISEVFARQKQDSQIQNVKKVERVEIK